MAISFKEQIDNFSNDFYINTAYIPYIVNGPECADGLSAYFSDSDGFGGGIPGGRAVACCAAGG